MQHASEEPIDPISADEQQHFLRPNVAHFTHCRHYKYEPSVLCATGSIRARLSQDYLSKRRFATSTSNLQLKSIQTPECASTETFPRYCTQAQHESTRARIRAPYRWVCDEHPYVERQGRLVHRHRQPSTSPEEKSDQTCKDPVILFWQLNIKSTHLHCLKMLRVDFARGPGSLCKAETMQSKQINNTRTANTIWSADRGP